MSSFSTDNIPTDSLLLLCRGSSEQFCSPPEISVDPQFFRRDWQRSYNHRLTESTSHFWGGARHAGRKRSSRATKTGSRRLVLPMVGVGAGRQQSTPPNRLRHCRAIARHIISPPNDDRIDPGNQCLRHPVGWKFDDTGTVG